MSKRLCTILLGTSTNLMKTNQSVEVIRKIFRNNLLHELAARIPLLGALHLMFQIIRKFVLGLGQPDPSQLQRWNSPLPLPRNHYAFSGLVVLLRSLAKLEIHRRIDLDDISIRNLRIKQCSHSSQSL